MNKRQKKSGFLSFLWLKVFIFLIASSSLNSQNENIRFKHISIEEGLSEVTVNCICQDYKGFMWFGTQEGLHRYDGYQFKIYKCNPKDKDTISDSIVFCIHEDKLEPGLLWIGTRNGLNKFDPKMDIFTRYPHDPKQSKSLSPDEVIVIYEEDQTGILWIGTRNRGLKKFDKKKEIFKHYKNDEKNPKNLSHHDVRSIYEDSKGFLWVGTNGGGLNQFNRKSRQFDRYTTYNKHLTSDKVMAIYKTSDGNMWIGTGGGGLYQFDQKNGKFEHYIHIKDDNHSLSHNKVSAICERQNGNLWIGTNGGGLNKLDRKTGKFFHYKHEVSNPHTLSNNNIVSIYEDRSGMLWIGNETGGINVFNPNDKPFSLYTQNIEKPTSDVWAIAEDSTGVLWIGTKGGGLKKLGRKSGEFEQDESYNKKGLKDVRAIYEDRTGNLWFGTHGSGLIRLDGKTNEFKDYTTDNSGLSDNNLRCIFEDHKGVMWIGTAGGGLNKFDKDIEIFTQPYQHDDNNPKSIGDDWIISIIEDKGNIVWIGTRGGGLNKFNRKNETFKSYRHDAANPKSLSHDFVLSVYEDHDGILWIGTFGGGLNKMTNRYEGIFEYYIEKDGLPSNVVYGILEDRHGNLWLSTNKGLSKFDPKTKTFKNYDFFDGLQSNEFSQGAYFMNKETGEMFFGGINGFNSFFPERIKDNTYIPQVVITDFLISNKSVPLKRIDARSPLEKPIPETDELTLSYKQNFFSFEFAALDYTSPQTNLYKYKLEGWDKYWIETNSKNRRATYTNLPAGNYIFKVLGSNSDGIWNEKGTSIKVKIIHPPWRTLWAYSLYVLAFIGLVYLIWSAWSKRFLKQKVKERTKELNLKNEELEKKHQELKNTQSQLVQSEKMAGLGLLVAGVAHEINNPASFAHTSAYNLEKDIEKLKAFLVELAGDEVDREIVKAFDEKFSVLFNHLNSIKEGTSRISKTVGDLRIFSRMEKGEMKPIKLLEGLQVTLNLVITQYKENVDFVTDFQADPEVEGNAAELNQVFMNILVNACQAILDKQKGAIEAVNGLITTQFLEEKGNAVISIKDNGIGMSQEVKRKMFDPFFTTRAVGEGIGLGLSISFGIIKKHGGRIEVTSEEGKGTTVTLYLPLGKKEKSIPGGR